MRRARTVWSVRVGASLTCRDGSMPGHARSLRRFRSGLRRNRGDPGAMLLLPGRRCAALAHQGRPRERPRPARRPRPCRMPAHAPDGPVLRWAVRAHNRRRCGGCRTTPPRPRRSGARDGGDAPRDPRGRSAAVSALSRDAGPLPQGRLRAGGWAIRNHRPRVRAPAGPRPGRGQARPARRPRPIAPAWSRRTGRRRAVRPGTWIADRTSGTASRSRAARRRSATS